ncbi:MAG TPA: lysylphosphatidylglycerol synthase domain-containing protein [Gemmatimonadaceae bacterium]|nr:lysylphosphatidylglycerol synthase domain-containing protein [Gemmatimonadaceae bacterium]
MAPARRRLLLAAQLAFVAAVVWFAVDRLAGQWGAVRAQAGDIRPVWSYIAAASGIVLGAYALLIQTWRAVVAAWGARIRFIPATRIFFVSNLGRYLPGKVWQITAMGMMAQRAGVEPVAAAGSALLVSVINVMTGLAVALAFGAAQALPLGGTALAAFVVTGLAVATAPRLVPWAVRAASRVLRRELLVPSLPSRAIWMAGAGTTAAWIAYGVAFRIFSEAVAPSATGAVAGYIAVYTASYLVGFLNPLTPGGLVVRETALVAGLAQLRLMSAPDAVVVAVASRLWLTAVEVAPGLAFLAYDAFRQLSHASREPTG